MSRLRKLYWQLAFGFDPQEKSAGTVDEGPTVVGPSSKDTLALFET
jgi:hypothetical protein